MALRLLLAAFLLAAAPAQAAGDFDRCEAAGIPNDFDMMFQIAARRWYPPALQDHWCIAKALCWIESRLNPEAESGVGALGLCQVMPATAQDLRGRNLWRGNLRHARDNAKASALAFTRKWDFWVTPRPGLECRLEVTLASYNAGEGNVLKAQVLSGGKLCWEGIRPFMAQVTGKHALEVVNYISRFWAAYRKLKGHGL